MLSKSRCPFTGVVNFFTETDPLLSVGSVAEMGVSGQPGRYVWRCYLGDESAGLAGDMSQAEALLRSALASHRSNRASVEHRKPEPAVPSRATCHWQKINETSHWRS
ncbi:MAG: hypothetical protein AB7O44_04195 [Hyphomicrobiaceae bacterium]